MNIGDLMMSLYLNPDGLLPYPWFQVYDVANELIYYHNTEAPVLVYDLRPYVNVGGGVYIENLWFSFLPNQREANNNINRNSNPNMNFLLQFQQEMNSNNNEDSNYPNEIIGLHHQLGFADLYIYMCACTAVLLHLLVAQPLHQCPFCRRSLRWSLNFYRLSL